MIHEIRLLLNTLVDVKIFHVYRESNEAAYGLARHSWVVDHIQMCWDGFPDLISQAIWLDSQEIYI